jgi:hypothetical protein
VAATASHVEGRGAGYTKTKPATTKLTILDVDYRSGLVSGAVLALFGARQAVEAPTIR